MSAVVWFPRIIWYDRHPRLRCYPRGRKVKPHSRRPLPFSFSEVSSFGATCSSYSTAHPPISLTGFHFYNSEMPVLSSVCASIFKQACLQFCTKTIHWILSPGDTLNRKSYIVPATEQVLIRFCSHLTDHIHHTSIKVYLFGVRWLHRDMGFGILWSTAYDSRDTCMELSVIKAPAAVHASLSQGTWWKVAIAPWISMTTDTLFQVACCLGFFFVFKVMRVYSGLALWSQYSPHPARFTTVFCV